MEKRTCRRVYMLFVVLMIYVLCSFIYTEMGLFRDHHFMSKISNYIEDFSVLMSTEETLMDASSQFCPNSSIIRKHKIPRIKISCVQHRPSPSACKFAQKIYAYDAAKRNCRKDIELSICKIQEGDIKCSHTACGRYVSKKIIIHTFNTKTGATEPIAYWSPKHSETLNKLVSQHAKISIENGYHFLFLSCGDAEKKTQLLLLNDASLLKKIKKETDGEGRDSNLDGKNRNPNLNGVNINIVMLDSIARGHFYRSLIKTVDSFNAINSAKYRGGSEVLDFELFQSLHGHSAENAHGLFNGTVFPAEMTDSERESQPVGIDHFFRYFKNKGYHTMYQDDMCWEAIWGFRSDIGGAGNWDELLDKFSKSSIDDSGLMQASCKIFKKFDTDHIFNLEEEQYVCYNGQQHDAYFLQYLLNHYSRVGKQGRRKTISYSALNVAHDSGGVRIQAIDKDLSQFVESISQLDDTLTIILADHGNTYTDFVYVELEGRYEMYHPSLFMIVPRGVQHYLGTHLMTSLRLNQKRLLTMIDLHHSLKYLADRSYPHQGVFNKISTTRDCSKLPLRFPNYCVCEGWSTPIENNTELVGHLEFAVGHLNNIISESSRQGKCKRIVPSMFDNALQRKVGDIQIMMFDIHALSGIGFDKKGEKISVELKSKHSGVLASYEMTMTSWDRTSMFGPYRECSDAADAGFRLCICDKVMRKRKGNLKGFFYHRTSKNYEIFGGAVKETFQEIVKDNVGLVVRRYYEKRYDDNDKEKEPFLIAVTFEAINFSLTTDQTFSVVVKIDDINNMKPMTPGDCAANVPPNTVKYLCTLSRKWHIWQAEYSFKVSVT